MASFGSKLRPLAWDEEWVGHVGDGNEHGLGFLPLLSYDDLTSLEKSETHDMMNLLTFGLCHIDQGRRHGLKLDLRG